MSKPVNGHFRKSFGRVTKTFSHICNAFQWAIAKINISKMHNNFGTRHANASLIHWFFDFGPVFLIKSGHIAAHCKINRTDISFFSFIRYCGVYSQFYIQLIFKAPLFITLMISDQKIVSGSLFFQFLRAKKGNFLKFL